MMPHLCQVGWDFRDPDFGKRKETTMRIVDVREITQLIASPIRNAYIDFSKMTASSGGRHHGCGPRRPAAVG